MRMMFKGNDEHGYLYVGGKDSMVKRVRNGVGATAGETGLMMTVPEVEKVVDEVMVVLNKRYKRVGHTSQGNGK